MLFSMSLGGLGRSRSPAAGGGGGGIPSIVQAKVANVQSGNDVTATFDSAVTAGNTIVVFVGNYDADVSTTGTCVDSKGNTYTRRSGDINAGNAVSCCIWTAPATTGGSSFAVTFDAGTSQYTSLIIAEVADCTGFEGAAGNDASGDPASVDPGATAGDNRLAVAVCATFSNTVTLTPGNSFTTIGEFESGYPCTNAASREAATTGQYDPTWALSAGPAWAACSLFLIGT